MDDERLTRFLDAQEHPERYTEEQLNDLMREGKDLALLKRAMMEERARHADLDVEAEWQTFNRRLADSNRRPAAGGRRLLRYAAMFAGLLLVAGIAYAAMIGLGVLPRPSVGHSQPAATITTTGSASSQPSAMKADSDTLRLSRKAEPTIKTFDNTPLATILGEMGKYYGVSIAFDQADSKAIRLYFEWNQAKSLDENIALLNSFRQIAIQRDGNRLIVK